MRSMVLLTKSQGPVRPARRMKMKKRNMKMRKIMTTTKTRKIMTKIIK